jgi:hypothetical protein
MVPVDRISWRSRTQRSVRQNHPVPPSARQTAQNQTTLHSQRCAQVSLMLGVARSLWEHTMRCDATQRHLCNLRRNIARPTFLEGPAQKDLGRRPADTRCQFQQAHIRKLLATNQRTERLDHNVPVLTRLGQGGAGAIRMHFNLQYATVNVHSRNVGTQRKGQRSTANLVHSWHHAADSCYGVQVAHTKV